MPDEGGARTAKGEQRREALVAAAAELLLAEGPDAVTARATASRAGVPLGATTYYFSDVAQLRRAAVRVLMDRQLEGATTHRAGLRRGSRTALVAERVVALVLGPYLTSGWDGVLALYARALSAAQDDAVARDLAEFDGGIEAAVADLLHAAGRSTSHARAVLACTDGFALAEALAGPRPDVATRIAARLADVLDLLAPRT